MKKQTPKLRRMTQLSLLLALEIVMALTPLGMLQIPPVSITIMHIPVIIGGILLGVGSGAFLGGAFGVLSMIRATFAAAGPIDLLFNPAVSGNPLASIIMAVLPRVLLGIVAALLWKLLSGRKLQPTLAIGISSAAACLVHSFGVLGFMSLFFKAFPFSEIFGIIIGFNGLIELGVAVVVGTAICRALLVAEKRG